MNNKNKTRGDAAVALITVIGFLVIGALISVAMVGCPKYDVYAQEMAGKAVLAHAQSSREVAVAEARAKMESSTLLAQAEVERAKGVAEANKIIGNSLKENEAYLRYLYIQSLADSKGEVIYIPTEAGLPILEAGRLHKP